MSRELKEKLLEILFCTEYDIKGGVTMDKYEDMAYTNERGIAWLSTLTRPEIWQLWVTRASNTMNGFRVKGKPEEYAKRIVIEAIWHRGFAKDLTDARSMSRCARRLRQPRDAGTGIDPKGVNACARDKGAYGMPQEFNIFDEFLENIVRPVL